MDLYDKKGATVFIGGFVDGKQIVWTGIFAQSATWASTTGNLVIRMKKGSQFWTPNYDSHVAYIHNDYTFLSGFKISDK